MTKETSDNGFVRVEISGTSTIDFDMRIVRKGLFEAANITRQEARRLVARRAISGAGEYPGLQTGRLMRSIKTFAWGKTWVAVGPTKTSSMKDFYPAILNYGVTGNKRRKDHRAQVKGGKWRIAPRRNYMVDALHRKRLAVRNVLMSAMMDALKPR